MLHNLHLNEETFVNIDPDIIITNIFNNNNECRKMADTINDDIFTMAKQDGYNLIFDGVGKNYDWYFQNVFQDLKTNGYKVYLCIVICDLEIALSRIKNRTLQTGRNVNESILLDIHEILKTNIPRYIDLNCSDIDEIYVFDNTNAFTLMYLSKCNKLGEKSKRCFVKPDYHQFNYVKNACTRKVKSKIKSKIKSKLKLKLKLKSKSQKVKS